MANGMRVLYSALFSEAVFTLVYIHLLTEHMINVIQYKFQLPLCLQRGKLPTSVHSKYSVRLPALKIKGLKVLKGRP